MKTDELLEECFIEAYDIIQNLKERGKLDSKNCEIQSKISILLFIEAKKLERE